MTFFGFSKSGVVRLLVPVRLKRVQHLMEDCEGDNEFRHSPIIEHRVDGDKLLPVRIRPQSAGIDTLPRTIPAISDLRIDFSPKKFRIHPIVENSQIVDIGFRAGVVPPPRRRWHRMGNAARKLSNRFGRLIARRFHPCRQIGNNPVGGVKKCRMKSNCQNPGISLK